MLTIYAHLVGILRDVAPHTRRWTAPPRSTRRFGRDCVFSHEIRSRVAPLPLTVWEGDNRVMLTTYAHLVESLRMAAPHNQRWTTSPRYTRRSCLDCVFIHEILSRVAKPPLCTHCTGTLRERLRGLNSRHNTLEHERGAEHTPSGREWHHTLPSAVSVAVRR